MLGPVYVLEWIQATRRAHKTPWRIVYAILLFVEAQWLTMNLIEYLITRQSSLLTYVAEALLYVIAAQQTIVILLVTPAFAAGSITDERRRGTLDFMLATPLTSVEIILGKWLGQATRVLYLISPGYVLLVLLAGTLGETDAPVFLAMLEQIALIYAITAISLLASVWSRSTPKAILITFAALSVIAFVESFLGRAALASSVWAAPLGMRIPPGERLLGIACLGLITAACLSIAAWRLRPAHENQQSAPPRVVGRWRNRPALGDAPMRWKERYTGDWMSVPFWSAAPMWLKYLALAGVIVATVILAPYYMTCLVLACVQVIGSILFVALRAAGSVTSERERQTFDSLLVTRMDARQMIRGKLWGHLDAVRPYMMVFLLAAGPCALAIDVLTGLGLMYAWLCSWLCLYYVGAIGVTASASAPSTWRGILATLIGCFGALGLTQLFLTYILISIWASLIYMMLPASVQSGAAAVGAVLAPIPGLLWLFAASEERLQQAEQWLIENDHAASGP